MVAFVACGEPERPAPPAKLEMIAADPDANEGARAIALEAGSDGLVRLSWIEPEAGGHALSFATLGAGEWGETELVARGSDWFVNWADVPQLCARPDGGLAATFLRRSGSGAYDYDVRLTQRALSGAWSEARLLHDAFGHGEHGFVSLASLGEGRTLAAWLDGRAAGAHGEEGAMQLRARTISKSGELEPEILVDPRVCDCCRTTLVALGSDEALLIYRDRSEGEVRDFSVVTLRGATASEPRPLWNDGWKIAGCPVNGAAAGASGKLVGVAWFTLGSENRARVQVSFSTDRGASFDSPRELSRRETDGFVDAALDADGVLWVTWLERVDREHGEWMLAPVTVESVGERIVLAETTVGRAAGCAQVALNGDELVFAWIEPGEASRVRAQLVRGLAALR